MNPIPLFLKLQQVPRRFNLLFVLGFCFVFLGLPLESYSQLQSPTGRQTKTQTKTQAQTHFQTRLSLGRGINYNYSIDLQELFIIPFEDVYGNYVLDAEINLWKRWNGFVGVSYLDYYFDTQWYSKSLNQYFMYTTNIKIYGLHLGLTYDFIKTKHWFLSSGVYGGVHAGYLEELGSSPAFASWDYFDWGVRVARLQYFPINRFGLYSEFTYGRTFNTNVLVGLVFKM